MSATRVRATAYFTSREADLGYRDLIGDLSEAVLSEAHFLGHTAGVGADKQAVLYLYTLGPDSECRDCMMWIPDHERCTVHGEGDAIRGVGSCGFFINGKPAKGEEPMGLITVRQSGYVENPYGTGFSCKRCTFWEDQKLGCRIVNPNSPGDTPGIIHGDACCNAWVIDDDVAVRD